MHKKGKFLGITLIACFVLLFMIQTMAARTGGKIAGLFSYEGVDPYGIYAWISVHHIIQMVIAVIIMIIMAYIYKIDWYFSMGNKRIGFRAVGIFTGALVVYILVGYAIAYFTGSLNPYPYPLDLRNVTGYLGFQLLLSGPSEEILFRALPIGLMGAILNKRMEKEVNLFKIPVTVLLAAVLFSVAHINWSIAPFVVSANVLQLIYSFALGIVYGITYLKSKSVVYPMLMHSISNVISVGVGYIMLSIL